jgi:hypothetical protein
MPVERVHPEASVPAGISGTVPDRVLDLWMYTMPERLVLHAAKFPAQGYFPNLYTKRDHTDDWPAGEQVLAPTHVFQATNPMVKYGWRSLSVPDRQPHSTQVLQIRMQKLVSKLQQTQAVFQPQEPVKQLFFVRQTGL